MAEIDADRLEALEDLVLLRRPIADAVRRLREFCWDSETDYVTLTRRDVGRVLDAFLDRQLNTGAVTLWADALESREDIGFESGFEDGLKEFIFTAANPAINEPIDVETALRWKTALETQTAP